MGNPRRDPRQEIPTVTALVARTIQSGDSPRNHVRLQAPIIRGTLRARQANTAGWVAKKMQVLDSKVRWRAIAVRTQASPCQTFSVRPAMSSADWGSKSKILSNFPRKYSPKSSHFHPFLTQSKLTVEFASEIIYCCRMSHSSNDSRPCWRIHVHFLNEPHHGSRFANTVPAFGK